MSGAGQIRLGTGVAFRGPAGHVTDILQFTWSRPVNRRRSPPHVLTLRCLIKLACHTDRELFFTPLQCESSALTEGQGQQEPGAGG